MHSDSLAMSLGNLPFLSKSRTRSVSPENVYGEKGKGGMAELSANLNRKWERSGKNGTGQTAG